MLYAGLDLSRKRLDFHLLDDEGATVEVRTSRLGCRSANRALVVFVLSGEGADVAEVDRLFDRTEGRSPSAECGGPAVILGERCAELGDELIATTPELVSLRVGARFVAER